MAAAKVADAMAGRAAENMMTDDDAGVEEKNDAAESSASRWRRGA